ncbi:hypothetical protein HBI76_141850 [Parastagonospora nodorum]|nr:hypothetical protein HBI76_141850 [Parastagonospora nodorum]
MHLTHLALSLITSLVLATPQPLCTPSTFTSLTLPGTQILNITTTQQSNLTLSVPDDQNHFAANITNLSACDVLITYTHTNSSPADTVLTTITLPLPSKWTGRLLGAGGGGWYTGPENPLTHLWAASQGFAVTSTDSGHSLPSPATWALVSPGHLNYPLLHNFADRCLFEAATLGKAVAKAYYGRSPSKSYWNGCSQGGRQGLILAQRFPEVYDGVLATAPGLHWGQLIMQFMWAQAVMNDAQEWPSWCEFEGISRAAVEFCDGRDGASDGIVLDSTCEFDAAGLVGKTVECPSKNSSAIVTQMAVRVARETWSGSKTPEGKFLWYGLDVSAQLMYHAQTVCGVDGSCAGDPNPLTVEWQKYFLALDPEFDVRTVNTTKYAELFKESVKYNPLLAPTNPDLSAFAKACGKMITWHGTADVLLGPKYTEHYVKSVYDLDSEAAEYYRYFEAPGLNHCGVGTTGYYPGEALESLIAWVEHGTEPNTLEALNRENGRKVELCLWPKKLVYVGGDAAKATSFACK